MPGTDCKNDGFDQENEVNGPPNGQYAYVPASETHPYFDLAKEFVLTDRMFTSQLDESFSAHPYLIAGQESRSVDVPFAPYWGCGALGLGGYVAAWTERRTYGKNEKPCFDNQTLGDELDAAGLTWRFYTSKSAVAGGEWSAYRAIRHIRYGPDWKQDVIVPQTHFFTALKRGQLANVTWITPISANSDHPNCGSGTGLRLGRHAGERDRRKPVLADDGCVRALGRLGRALRSRSAAVHGLRRIGLSRSDDRHLTVRKEILRIARAVRDGEHSALRRGSVRSSRAASSERPPRHLAGKGLRFDFSQAPRPFVPIKTVNSQQFFMTQYDDHRPPDDQ